MPFRINAQFENLAEPPRENNGEMKPWDGPKQRIQKNGSHEYNGSSDKARVTWRLVHLMQIIRTRMRNGKE